MNKYEIALVVSTRIDDDQRNAALEKVKSYVDRYQGSVVNVDDQGKKRMAYEIQDMKEGYYYFITFEGPVEAPARIEKKLRIMDSVIRFLIVRQDA